MRRGDDEESFDPGLLDDVMIMTVTVYSRENRGIMSQLFLSFLFIIA